MRQVMLPHTITIVAWDADALTIKSNPTGEEDMTGRS
jgi:hypothetical protein